MDKSDQDILLRSRPWAASTTEEMRAAETAQSDPAGAEFCRQQNEFNARIHQELSTVPLPPDLREQILARRKVVAVSTWRVVRPLLALAAALVIVGTGLFYWLEPREDISIAGFRSRMVGFAVREYRMDLFTNNLPVLQRFLASKGDPAQFPIPPRLAALPLQGGASLSWQSKPVSMVCFDWSGKETLYMFVLAETLADSPLPTPQAVKGLSTVTWSTNGQTFLLAGRLPADKLNPLVSAIWIKGRRE